MRAAALLFATVAWAGTADVRGGPCDRLGVRRDSLVQVTCLALRAARAHLARARENLARALKARDPDRHFLGLPESRAVIDAYDPVRAAEKVVAGLEQMSP